MFGWNFYSFSFLFFTNTTYMLCLQAKEKVFCGISIVRNGHFYLFYVLQYLPLKHEIVTYLHFLGAAVSLQYQKQRNNSFIMKTRNIITIISIIFALVSCSADSDILNDMPVQNTESSGVESVISCSIGNMQTKASVTVADDEITNAVFFLLDGEDNVLGYRINNTKATFQTKDQADLKVLVVANASQNLQNSIINCSTGTAIWGQTLGADDLKSLVKIGEKKVGTFTNSNASVEVIVKQIAARIDIASLTLNIKDADEVTLEQVELINQNTKGYMDGKYVDFVGTSTTALIAEFQNRKFDDGIAQTDICTFYSFANEDVNNKTTLKLSFKIDGKTVNTLVTIKDSSREERVVSAANHQLTITATIIGDNVTPEVTFTVADWNKSQISVDLEEK